MSLKQASHQQLRAARPADQRGIYSWLPGLYVLRHYQPAWLPADLVAGVVLTAVLVPVGMAYAQASGLSAIHGLYATIIPLVVYAVAGPSRILVLGPDSSLAPMIAVAILPLAAGDPAHAESAAALLAIMAGMFGVAAGLLRLGFITDLLAKPIRYGYMNGIALTVLVSQLPNLLGFSVKGDGFISRIAGLVSAVVSGKTNWITLAVGGGTLLTILLLKRWLRLPGVLLAVSGALLTVAWFDLSARFGVAVIGPMPQGLPSFSIPVLSLHDIGNLATAALAIAVVSFADTSVLSRVYSAKSRSYVNPNQEMIGLGLANLATGLFQGFPVSSSSSRTPVAEASGSKTQLTGLVGALAIALLLVLAPRLLRDLPYAALAAVVIASAIGLFELGDLGRLYRIQRWEFWLSLAAFFGVVLLGPVPGMMIAIGIALAEFIWDGWNPHFAILGRADHLNGFHDLKRYPHARQMPGLLLFRWDAPLFFANSDRFREAVLDAVVSAPTPVSWLVVAAEPVTSIDVTAFDMLVELDGVLQKAGITMLFAEMKDPVKDKLKRFLEGKQTAWKPFFPTVDEAVVAYEGAHGVTAGESVPSTQ